MKKNKIRFGIIIGITLLCLATIVGFIYIKEVVNSVTNQNNIYVKEVTRQLSNNISDKMDGSLRELKLVSKNLTIDSNTSFEFMQEELRNLYDRSNFIEILVSDIYGNAKTKDGFNLYIGDRDYFKNTIKGKPSISHPIESKLDGKDIIVYTIPIIYKGDVVGLLAGLCDAESVMRPISTKIYDENRCTFIISQGGKIIHSNHAEDENKRHFDEDIKNKFLEKLSLEDTGSGKEDIKGERKYIGYSKIEATEDWYIVTSVPEGSVFVDTENIIQNTTNILVEVLIVTMLVIIYIIGSRVANDIKLEKANYEDNLTEISNYDKFIIDSQNSLSGDNENKKQWILVCFDIVKFRLINDIYGYKVGDEILKSISNNLKTNFKEEAVYGRLSGDIFALLIKEEEIIDDLPNLVNTIKNKIVNIDCEEKFNRNINIDVYMGIYFVEDKDTNIKDIIGNAEMARIKSKEVTTTNYVVFDENIKEEKQILMQIEQDLFSAIEKQQLKVYYQPKYDYSKEKIVGFESLIRWQHPTMGMVSPLKFIPIAEKNGFINEIGKWIIEEVFSTLSKSILEDLDIVPISINLSRVELYQEHIVEYLEKMLKKYNIPNELIEIEITETTTLNDVDFISQRIREIKKLGIAVSMDDFGTGNSNFSNLKNIPIDTLKIDRSLLLDIEESSKAKLMVKSIIDLCKALNLNIVCEGVENISQVYILKEIGVDIIQGYVYSKPISFEEYKILLNKKGRSQI
ncbi:EAL domain-containing protein [Romboutsia weinsteinii]|uniref:EAL domain-containing protein n=1 Tax=Romboutsia weinsteinii TaxID=2020949 RepID=A0A371J3U3_9FIRM|nr:EAL domain-containing protein [Romboutsia weinsteinii]RDY27383.1 EAL domain-containing protein [Romboutsia weinsteinii]